MDLTSVRIIFMVKLNLLSITTAFFAVALVLCGCVERKLTINTEPKGALVVLNDEEIGESPVTVNFKWYGDYSIRISKESCETLNTHRKLKGPWYNHFPWDFFAQIVNPSQIVDWYEWSFELEPKHQLKPQELIRNAKDLKAQM